MTRALLGWIAIAGCAFAQDGRVQGAVVDAATRAPVRKASVTLRALFAPPGQNQPPAGQSMVTDASGAFQFSGLSAGRYQLQVIHQNYPQKNGGALKTIEVSSGDSNASVTVELVPGASVTGHVVDEDGDPLSSCFLALHPVSNSQGFVQGSSPNTREDGSYKLFGVSAGKYTISAQCSTRVFQPRPLSEGPDPPPSAAYPPLYYPGARDAKSAQVIELMPGAEKSGVDFQMRPVPVTHIHGTLTVGSADWHGRTDLHAQLWPVDSTPRNFGAGGQVNAKDGTFELTQVFPGSYRLIVFTQNFARNGESADAPRVGAVARVDVTDKPVELSLPLQGAMDVSGSLEIERGNNNSTTQVSLSQLRVQLTSNTGTFGASSFAEVNDDGSFTLKSVLPGEWRIRLTGPSVFLKSARSGNDDVTHKVWDLSSGTAAPLRIVASTNMATVRGSAPAGQTVIVARIDPDDPQQGWTSMTADSNGQFTMYFLAPGRYRVVASDPGGGMPDEGGQEVTVGEGETAMVDVKPVTNR